MIYHIGIKYIVGLCKLHIKRQLMISEVTLPPTSDSGHIFFCGIQIEYRDMWE